jgi:ATP-dependent Clp protease protease subunit
VREQNKYYQLVVNEDDSADLYIYGDISSWGQWGEDDPDRSAYNIVNELQGITKGHINVHINSYGGDVSEGLAIYNCLKNSGKEITTICDGFACSAASVIFMAGQKRVMNSASLLMIHNAWTYASGDAEALRKVADDIETITQASVNAYVENSNISEEEIKKLMDDETWILPVTAVEYGFATEIKEESEEGVKQSAFSLIINKLVEKPAENKKSVIKQEVVTLDEDSINAIAEAVVEKLNAETNVDEEDVEEKTTPINEWTKFFAN